MVLGRGFLDVPHTALSAPALATDPSKAAVVQAWLDARTRGDQDAAAALLADDVFYIGNPAAPCNPQGPCYDRASVQQSNSAVDARNANRCYSLAEVQVAGNVVTGRFDNRSDAIRGRGIERIISAFMAEVVDGKIAKIVQFDDTGDAQTVLFRAVVAGSAQPGAPLPTPDPPCG
jgi:ketosteroid isomerase-like protein